MKNFELLEIDYVEFYVGNAFHSAIFYKEALGFNIVGYYPFEKGISYLLKQNECFLILTSSFDKSSSIYKHVLKHGDSIKDIGILVKNVDSCFKHMEEKGAEVITTPFELKEASKKIKKYTIKAFGDLTHSFIERPPASWNFPFWKFPFYKPLHYTSLKNCSLQKVDHIAIALKRDNLQEGISFYEDICGFYKSHEEEVLVGKGGMKSAVMSSLDNKIKFPLVCPIGEMGHSQIDKYLSYNEGEGAQHIAFLSDDIILSSQTLRENGVNFLEVPESYYENIPPETTNPLKNRMKNIKDLGILLSGEKAHLLMQVFSKPLQVLPTFFIEVIERRNNQGFGSENIKALFEAVALDQKKGNI